MPTGCARAAARSGTSRQVGAWLFLAALVAAGCNKTESCRTGTLLERRTVCDRAIRRKCRLRESAFERLNGH